MYKPGDAGWDEAKLLAKNTALLLVTVREHLIWSHFVLANATTTISITELKPSQPLHRLLTIFTYRTTYVNSLALETLLKENAILHRSVGLTFKAMLDLMDMSYETCNIYQPFPDQKLAPEIQKLVNDDKFPYILDSRAY